MMSKIVSFCVSAVLLLSAAASCSKDKNREITAGAMFDLTGQTAETGTKYAEGIRNYFDYINKKGGINGKKVKLLEIDTAYMPARDLLAYEKFVKQNKVDLMFGWSTGGTAAVIPHLRKDRVPYTSVSMSKDLLDSKKAPTFFMAAPTYSDQIKILFKYILEETKGKSAKPRVALIYNDTSFGRSPVADARKYAAEMGIEITSEEIVFLDARDAVEQISRIKLKKPDYVIINETAWAASVILKEADRAGLKAKFAGLIWCADDKVINLAGKAAEGYIGVFPFLFDSDIPGIREIIKYNSDNGLDNFTETKNSIRYINGWTTAMFMLEGVRLAGGDHSREGIIRGLEKINNFSTGGITAPYNFSAKNHTGIRQLKLARVENGKWRVFTDFLSAE